MLFPAFTLLSATVLLGAVLAVLRFRGRPPHWLAGAAHGTLGLLGLALLLLALRGPPRGVLTGVAQFATIAAILATAALLIGLAVLLLRRRREIAGLIIGVHATVAITAYVMLLAYVSLS